MSERIKFVLHPSEGDQSALAVEDALRQILDIVKLASAEADDPELLNWQLISATTNSPLVIEVEAFGTGGVSVDAIAHAAKARFANSLREIQNERIPEKWKNGPLHAVAKGLFKRNANGIGLTDIIFETDNTAKITHAIAEKAVWLLERPQESKDKSHDEMGSLDAYLLEVGTHYNSPAIKVEDRLTKHQLWCRVSKSQRDAISQTTKLDDVWEHRRVRIVGLVSYDRQGKISGLQANEITLINSRKISVVGLYDKDFTSGRSPEEHLEDTREGKIV